MALIVLLKLRFMCKLNYARLCSSFTVPEIDTNYYCDSKNAPEIRSNIHVRKGVGNIDKVLDIFSMLNTVSKTDPKYNSIKRELHRELMFLPNRTHPTVRNYEKEPNMVRELNKIKDFEDNSPLEFSEIVRRLNIMRTDKLGHTGGHKSYYFMDELAELEEALIKYSISFLLSKNFELVSVPDILPKNILESCGMTVNGDRTQIYSLDAHHHGPDRYLSGTAEISLAGLLMNTVYQKNILPLKLAAVSRCYRAETSNVIEERGIYRVHQFTKVEMFAVTTPEQSDEHLEYIRRTQEDLFSPLGFHMKVLDMPPHELGAPAYRKYDIESWMPGRKKYGEISSCSNCTDYQSRRLNIKYDDDGKLKFVHTLNGTACALPRMIITLVETHQDSKGKIFIPKVLQPFMNGKFYISRSTKVPELKLKKLKNI